MADAFADDPVTLDKPWRYDRAYDGMTDDVAEQVYAANNSANGHSNQLPVIQTPAAITATVFKVKPSAEIQSRQWLFGRHYVRGFVSATLGRAGIGKTGLLHAESVAMASAAAVLGPALNSPLRVWYIGEDPPDELERRLVAICQRYQIGPAELGNRLHVDSTLKLPSLRIAEQKAKGLQINDDVIDRLAEEIGRRTIDVLMLDPLIKFHGVPEGDNTAMEAVMRSLSGLADRTNIAIDVSHHVRKQAPGTTGPATVDDGRGASAIIGAIRSARLLNPMQTTEAEKAGIAEGDRWRYLRLDRAKANMAPPEAARWFALASEILPCGESVGVVETWKFPDAFAGVTGADVSVVRELARTCAYRSDPRSANWFGKAVAKHLRLDVENKQHCARVKVLIKTWLKNKVLDIEPRHDPERRKEFEYIIPGPWTHAEQSEAADAQVLD